MKLLSLFVVGTFFAQNYGNIYFSNFAESVCNLPNESEVSKIIVDVSCAKNSIITSILKNISANVIYNEADVLCSRFKNKITIKNGISIVNSHNILTSIVDLMIYWRRYQGAFLYDQHSGLSYSETMKYIKKRGIKGIVTPLHRSNDLEVTLNESLIYQNIVIICRLELLNLIIEKGKSLNLFVQNYTWLIVNNNVPKPIIGIDIPPNSQVTLITPIQNNRNSTIHNIEKTNEDVEIGYECDERVGYPANLNLTQVIIRLHHQDKNAVRLKTSPEASIYDIFFSPTTQRTESIKFAEWKVSRQNRLIQIETFDPKDKLRLRERRVRVVVFEHFPYSVFTKKDGNFRVDGYLKDMIETLLINYNLRYTLREIEPVFGIGIGGTYTGMVGVFFRREADLAMNVLAMTNSRASAVRYAGPVTKAYLAIIYNRPEAIIPPTTYLMPFNLSVWVAIFILLTIIIVSTFITLTTSPSSNNEKNYSLSHHLHKKIFRIISLTYIDEVLEYPFGAAAKVIHGTLLLSTLAVFIHYTSTFTAFLTYQEEKMPFKSIEDVVARKEYSVLLIKNTRHQDMFQYAPPGPYLNIWNRVIKQGETSFSQTFESGFSDLSRLPKYVLLTDGPTNIYLSGGNCSIAFAPVKYLEEYYNTPHRRDFPYTRIFTMGLTKILESGILRRLTLAYRLANRPPCNPENTSNSFGLSQVMGIFVLHACGIILSLIVLLIERSLPKHLPHLALKKNLKSLNNLNN